MLAALTACSCSTALEHDSGRDRDHDLAASMEQTRQRSEKSQKARLESERISPEEEAREREARASEKFLRPGQPIWIQSGKSRILQLERPVRRVSIGNPDLAGIVVLGPQTLMINAKEVPPRPPASARHSTSIIATETITPAPSLSETTIVIWDGPDGHYDSHTLTVADFNEQQVMLEVTVAELRRTALEEHGISVRVLQNNFISAYFMGGGGGPSAGATGGPVTVPPQSSQPLLPLATSGFGAPTYAFILPDQDITAFIEALQTEGLATLMAQPKIMAMSGQTAVFQVGGEIPIRIATGFAADVVFKPFGVLVNFLPRVSDDGNIMLTVTPEVSQPDFSRQVEGIPSFRTRRVSTSANLRNGQTMVIGGLLETDRQEQVRGVPYLMNVPGLGYLFRNTTYTDEIIEFMVIVTPRLIRPLPAGTRVQMPTDRGPLSSEEINTQSTPAEVTRPRIPGAP